MHPIIVGEIAAQRITELHQQAAKQRLIRQLRASNAASHPNGRLQVGWVRLSLRRSRPAAA